MAPASGPRERSTAVRELLREADQTAQEGWRQVGSSQGVVVLVKRVPNSTQDMVKGFATVSVSPRCLANCITTVDRQQWDELYTTGRDLESDANGATVTYLVYQSPIRFVSGRDAVLSVERREMADGTIVLGYRSTEHPDMPVQRGLVRAQVHLAGFVIRPHGENHSLVTYLLHVDLRGSVPQMIVNQLILRSPQLIRRLEAVALQSSSEGTADPDELLELFLSKL